MKYLKRAIFFILIFFSSLPAVCRDSRLPKVDARSAILIESRTGMILYEQNARIPLPPASLTKMMTEYLLMEEVAAGRISWTDIVNVSEYAYSISAYRNLSEFSLEKNAAYTVRKLFEAVSVYSANSAAIMLAEHISGGEPDFVREMNSKASSFGMDDTRFFDSTGLSNGGIQLQVPYPSGGNRMSALSAAKLANRLVSDYPGVTGFSSIRSKDFIYRNRPSFRMVNRNWMLPGLSFGYDGIDGLKTGHTASAGFCLAATAMRNGIRLISVVMGTASRGACFRETKKLLDHGFDNIILKDILPSGSSVVFRLHGKEKKEFNAVTRKPLRTVVWQEKDTDYRIVYRQTRAGTEAPVVKGQLVGYACAIPAGENIITGISSEKRFYERTALFAAANVEGPGILERALLFIKEIVRRYYDSLTAGRRFRENKFSRP
ncbi:MAG: D-alanyl-D-alanine carboxypeptidase family protein [Elusimicrobiota bacterium]